MGILAKNELEILEEHLSLLRAPVPETEKVAQDAEIQRLALYLDELMGSRGFVL